MKRSVIFILFLSLCSMVGNAQSLKQKDLLHKENGKYFLLENGRKSPVNDKIITVKVKEGKEEIPKGIVQLRKNKLGYVDLMVPDSIPLEDFAAQLDRSENYDLIKYATYGTLCLEPNDAYINSQWYLDSIRAHDAWNFTMGSSDVKVAVIDAIPFTDSSNHSDLYYGSDGYSNINWSLGYDYTQMTSSFHGLSVAGVISAKTNNLIGIAGICGGNHTAGTCIIPFNVDYDEDHVDMSSVDDAIINATDSGAKVINMSLGCHYTNFPDIDDAIDYAYSHGVLLVAASGNDSLDNNIDYPASNIKVVAVGSVGQTLSRSDFSNVGAGLEIAAPGQFIRTIAKDNGCYYYSGTSFASPQVAGVAALMLSVNPNLTVDQIRSILHDTARDLGSPGYDTTYGYGLVDAYAAVNSAINAYGFSIIGPENLCGPSIYSIANLPSGYTVEWSLPSNLSSIITTDYPQANQCTIINNGLMIDTYLTAILKNSAGQAFKSLIKRVRSTFDITFHQTGTTYNGVTYPSIPNSTVKSNQTIIVNHMCRVFLDSPYFSGMTVSHTGASHQFWNTLDGISFKFSPVTTTETMMITGSDGCHMINLQVLVTPNENIPVPMLTAIGTSSGYDILLSMKYDDDDMAIRSQDILVDDMTEWDISVTNIMTANRVYRSRVRGKSISISTIGWKSGVYIVEGVVNGLKAQCKIVVK